MKYKCKQRQEIWKKTNRRKAQSSLNRGLDNMANMKEMKRCLTAKPIRVTLPNVCRHKSNRDSRECLEGSGCEAKSVLRGLAVKQRGTSILMLIVMLTVMVKVFSLDLCPSLLQSPGQPLVPAWEGDQHNLGGVHADRLQDRLQRKQCLGKLH